MSVPYVHNIPVAQRYSKCLRIIINEYYYYSSIMTFKKEDYCMALNSAAIESGDSKREVLYIG